MSARDDDANSNGVVSYQMASTDDGLFSLDRRTGKLLLTRSVTEPERDPVYLEVVARDEAVQSERKSATTTLTIIGKNIDAPFLLYRLSSCRKMSNC